MNEISDVNPTAAIRENLKFAKFIKPLHVDDGKEIWLLVSLENERQSGENLTAFFDLITRLSKNEKITSKVKIILSDYLNRHYRGVEKAKEMGQQWRENNCLANFLNVEIEIVKWKDLFEQGGVKKRIELLKIFYQENEEFRIIVNNLASSHAKKASPESAKDYIFEECAVISGLSGHLCYPSDSLNEALKLSIAHFNSMLEYNGYAIYDRNKKNRAKAHKQKSKEKDNESNTKLMLSCLKMIETMERFGIHGQQNQSGFFQQFLALKDQYSLGGEKKSYGAEDEQKFNESTREINSISTI